MDAKVLNWSAIDADLRFRDLYAKNTLLSG